MNKATKLMKDAFAQVYAQQQENFNKWITEVAEGIKEAEPILDADGNPELDKKGNPKVEWVWLIRPDPHGAAKLAFEAAEFVRPKLARTELTGKDGNDIQVKGTIEFVSPIPRAVS